MAWTTFSDFVLDQIFGYQSANYLKNNPEAMLSFRMERNLGGSRENPVQGSGSLDPYDYRDVEIVSTNVSGLSIRARCNTKTSNAGTSVQPKIRRTTDAADHVTGAAHTGTSFVEELLTMTPITSGTKVYQLMLVTNNATNPVYGFGHIESYL